MIGVVLAAGRGTRLRPVTDTRSKAMVPVLGRPLVERVMETLAAAGVDDFVVVAGPGDHELEAHLESGMGLGARIRVVVQHQRLGAAHALGCAARLVDDAFILTACDSLCTREHVQALAARHLASGAAATLTLMQVEPEAVSRSAAVVMEQDRVRHIVEKPAPGTAPSSLVSLPLYAFAASFLDHLAGVTLSPRGEYELQQAIQSQIDSGDPVGGVVTSWREQVSTPDDLLRLNLRYLGALGDQVQGRPQERGDDTLVAPPAYIGPGVRLGSGCRVGPGVVLEGPCVVGDGAFLEETLVLRNARVAENARVCRRVLTRP